MRKRETEEDRMVRILLADSHTLVRAGVRALLESSGRADVVGEASSGGEAVAKARNLIPDIVIMGLMMPETDGIRATRQITKLGLPTRVLILTVHDEDEYLEPALDAGAAGFLSKSVAEADIMRAIEALIRGHSYLPSRVVSLLALSRRKADRQRGNSGAAVLSPRELTVIKLYARGFAGHEIARRMFLSPKTVEGYMARAKAKLALRRRRDIVSFAVEAGLLGVKDEDRSSARAACRQTSSGVSN